MARAILVLCGGAAGAGPTAVAAAGQRVGLEVDPALFQVRLAQVGASDRLLLAITNRSPRTLTFVRPLPMSFSGHIEPTYRVEARDDTGRVLRLVPQSRPYRLIGRRQTVVLRPGQVFRATFRLPTFWQRPDRVRVRYGVHASSTDQLPLPQTIPPALASRLRRLFRGTLTSAEISLRGAGPRRPFVVTPGRPTVLGSLDRGIIERVVFHSRQGLFRCLAVRATLRPPPPPAVDATLELVIAATGTVARSTLKRSSTADPGLGDCLVGWSRTLRFPSCKCSAIVIVRYPFHISGG